MFRYFLGFSLFLSSLNAAAAIPVVCNSCVTDSEFRQRAILEEAITNRGGTYWVYNLRDNLVQKWYVPASSGGSSGGGTRPRMAATAASESRATKQTVEQTVIAEVNAGHNLYIVGKGTLRPIYYVPISYVNLASANNKSTYDIVRDNNLKAQIESKLGDLDIVRSIVKQDVLATMVNIMQVATNYVGLKEQARIVFRVVMNDGTYIDFFLNPLDTTADAQENTARTASGQLIPENSQQAVGSWTAQGSDNLGQMADHMGKIGASVEYVGEGNFVNSITCTPQRCIVERQIR